MNEIVIRNFKQDDMPALGEFYQAVTAGDPVIFWWVGEQENYPNVFCAFEGQQMVAKGQVAVFNIIAPECVTDSKHKIFLNLKAFPGREEDVELLDSVYERLLARAHELKATLPDSHGTILCVGNYLAEESCHRYFQQQQGYQYLHSLYSLKRDLNEPVAELPLPEGVDFIQWSMETPEEQKQYMQLEAEVWPDAPIGAKRLAEHRSHPLWTAIIAREAGTIVGSVMVWQEDEGGVVEDVFVRDPWRRRGIARFLLSHALKYLQGHGLETASLVTGTDNHSAQALYHSVGFHTESEETRYYIEL
ncbi:GNAT family N-acetyltransferase [Paenibacillus sp. 22594]|uniref:GNAT family N-acetyltransferase n=1 Tax=Paenibacillus sp. 22594 TaxID=3453947 RepID=UPI003F859143